MIFNTSQTNSQMSKIFLLPRYFSAGVWARCWSQVRFYKKKVAIQIYWHWLRTVHWIFLDLVMPQLFGIRCLSKANSKLLFRCSWVPKWMTNVPINKTLEKITAEYSSKNIPPFLYPPKPMAHGRYHFLARLTGSRTVQDTVVERRNLLIAVVWAVLVNRRWGEIHRIRWKLGKKLATKGWGERNWLTGGIS